MENLYRKAVYEVLGDAGFVMSVGNYSEELADLFTNRGFSSAAFLTAHNPGSVKYSDSANQAAQLELETLLETRGIPYLMAMGRDPDPTSNWQSETSVLALGLSNSAAIEIAKQFRQAAILWCSSSATPELQMICD